MLGYPLLVRMTSNSKLDDTTRGMMEKKERVKLPKEGIYYCDKVTRPNFFGRIFEEGIPVLVGGRTCRSRLPHIFLDGSLGYLYIEF